MNLFKKKKSSIDKSEILSISTLQKGIDDPNSDVDPYY